MIPRFVVVLLWLAAGHAALAALAWAFLNVPESSLLMVGASGALALLMLVGTAWIEAMAILAWDRSMAFRERWPRALRALFSFILALAVFGGMWAATAAAADWIEAHTGEINAVLISRANLVESAWVFRTLNAILFVLRWIVGLSLAIAGLAFGTRRGFFALFKLPCLRAGLSGRQLAVTGGVVALLALLLRTVYWRPATLPPTQAELAFAIGKLGAIFLAVNAGWALLLWAGADGEYRDALRTEPGRPVPDPTTPERSA